jgi:hypothetical protein
MKAMRTLPTAVAALLATGALLVGYGGAGYVTAASRAHAHHAKRAVHRIQRRAAEVHVNMDVVTSTKAHPDWPAFTNPFWTAKVGDTVILTIRSFDDGTAPVPAEFAKVTGTVGGVEQVDGKTVAGVPAQQVAHTFTVPALGLNIPIPVAPKGGSVTVVAVIHLTKAGTFDWQCMAPCGSGANGWGGAMAANGYMRGAITIQG